jgi:hypothetical protein
MGQIPKRPPFTVVLTLRLSGKPVRSDAREPVSNDKSLQTKASTDRQGREVSKNRGHSRYAWEGTHICFTGGIKGPLRSLGH